MRTGRWTALCAGIVAVWTGTALARPTSSGAAGRFNAAYERLAACDDGSDAKACQREVARAGREIDRYVAGLLQAGRSAEEINRALGKLAGYLPATEGKGVQASCATFWSEPPRAAPSYMVAPIPGSPGGPADQVLGIFNFSRDMTFGPGHLSLFTKTDDGWRRTAGLDSSEALAATCLDYETGCATLVVSEEFLGADRTELSVSTWKIGAGSLTREARHWDGLMDADLEQTATGIRILYTKMPEFIHEAVLGARLILQIDLTAGAGGTEVNLTDLKPWLTAADLAVGAARGEHVVAPALRGAGVETLRDNVSTVDHESGDLSAGHGIVALRDGEDETVLWCLHVTRRADGVWRVQSVRKTKTCGGTHPERRAPP